MIRKILALIALVITIESNAQITFQGCAAAVLGAQDFTLVITGTTDDAGTIRNTFESNPADFTQGCPAGVCELRIIWNIAMARWEIQLDNDGPVITPDYTTSVLFYNTSASVPNPPSLLLGTWVDALGGACGGDGSFTTLTGDVQDFPLGIDDVALLNKQITMFPNPATHKLKIKSSIHTLKSVVVYSLLGKEVLSVSSNFNQINISDLASNLYLVKIETTDGATLNKKLLVN